MTRTKDNVNLMSRTSRAKLPKSRTPYWMTLEKGRSLGYYKGLNGGTWLARFYDATASPKIRQHPLGSADDFSEADGKMVLSMSQAQAAAREWFKVAYHQATGHRVQAGPFTVGDAVREYLEDRAKHEAKTANRMKWDFDAHVLPLLGDVQLAKLTRKRLEDWLESVAISPVRHRGKPGKAPETPDEIRARRATANRVMKNLKAALNLALREGHVGTDAGWKDVAAFRGTKAARVRFLSVPDQQRLVNAAPSPDFRKLLQAGLFTGARESEIGRLQVKDFDPGQRTLYIEFSKSGKSRFIHLTDEALSFFTDCARGKAGGETLFPRTTYDRKPKGKVGDWSRAGLSRLMRKTCTAAELEPLVFHELRHTCASTWINAGVPLAFVAEQLGHRDTRMVHEHYGHLCQNAKAEFFRKLTPSLGIHVAPNVKDLQTLHA